jgi:mono/diheme cytochrome c family protein
MNDDIKSSCHQPDAEPTATRAEASKWIVALMVVTVVMIFFGGHYLDTHGGWFDPKVYAPYQNADEVLSFQPQSGAAAAAARGRKVYEAVCGVCHGVDGAGKPGQFPPLAGSEWVNGKGVNRLVRIPLQGLVGTITVQGKDWNLNMAAMGVALSDDDLAAVLTYVRTSWGNKAGEVTADDVKKVRAEVAGHQATTAAELMKLPE